jgi:hypothetical protein
MSPGLAEIWPAGVDTVVSGGRTPYGMRLEDIDDAVDDS